MEVKPIEMAGSAEEFKFGSVAMLMEACLESIFSDREVPDELTNWAADFEDYADSVLWERMEALIRNVIRRDYASGLVERLTRQHYLAGSYKTFMELLTENIHPVFAKGTDLFRLTLANAALVLDEKENERHLAGLQATVEAYLAEHDLVFHRDKELYQQFTAWLSTESSLVTDKPVSN